MDVYRAIKAIETILSNRVGAPVRIRTEGNK